MGELSNSLFVLDKYLGGDGSRASVARLLLEKTDICVDNICNTATTLSAFGYRATLVAFLCVSYMDI